MNTRKQQLAAFNRLLDIMDDLREKCPWDKKQTLQSLRHLTIEETYELADAIDAGKTDGLVEKYDSLKSEAYPDNIIDIYWLERFHFGKGNYSISDQLSDIMVRELPGDWEVHDIKGQNLEELKDFKNAKSAYEKALELNPENESLKEKISRCASRQQRW